MKDKPNRRTTRSMSNREEEPSAENVNMPASFTASMDRLSNTVVEALRQITTQLTVINDNFSRVNDKADNNHEPHDDVESDHEREGGDHRRRRRNRERRRNSDDEEYGDNNNFDRQRNLLGNRRFRENLEEFLTERFDLNHRRTNRGAYVKPYPEHIDRSYEFPRGYKVPDFVLFSGEDNRSPLEHVSRFTMQCGEASCNNFLKLRLFPCSLTGLAFTWYSELPENSVHTWEEMEHKFRAQFTKNGCEVSMADLVRMKQQHNEKAEAYLERFKWSRLRCKIPIPESEFVKIAQDGLVFSLRKKFERLIFNNLSELTERVNRYEKLLEEESNTMTNNTVKNKLFHKPVFYSQWEGEEEDRSECQINVAEFIGTKPIICPALQKLNVKASQSLKPSTPFRSFTFNVEKASKIFDKLYKADYIKLGKNQEFVEGKEEKKYCK